MRIDGSWGQQRVVLPIKVPEETVVVGTEGAEEETAEVCHVVTLLIGC